MVSPVIFAGALTSFAGAMPPWAPPWWRGRFQHSTIHNTKPMCKAPISPSQIRNRTREATIIGNDQHTRWRKVSV